MALGAIAAFHPAEENVGFPGPTRLLGFHDWVTKLLPVSTTTLQLLVGVLPVLVSCTLAQ